MGAEKLTPEALKAKGLTKMRTIDEVTVPGAVAGWDALHRRWGKLSLAEDMAPAIALADKGIAVTETDAENWNTYGMPFRNDPEFAARLSPWRQSARRRAAISQSGTRADARADRKTWPRWLLPGKTAAAILKLERQLGGFMEAEDLSAFQPEWVDPVSTTYHGWTVYEMPPNGQGIAALEMLNIMEQFPIKEWGHNSQKSLHVEIEAKKLAYADLQKYVGDPASTHIPTAALISKDLAAQRAKLITDKAPAMSCLPMCSRGLLVCRATPLTLPWSIVTATRSL